MSLEQHAKLIELSEPKLQVRSILGTGGWGNVFEAWHTGLDRAVAVKVLHSEVISKDPQAWQRAQREAMTLSRLTHKNIVRVYSFGKLMDGSPFMTMELLKGVSLADQVKDSPLSLEVFRDVFMQTCAALKCLHDNDVLHRDLKTANIMLVKDERGNKLVKVMDFGLALDHGIAGGELQRLTATGEVVGSAQYMSPEQCAGKPLDKRSDIYSLGCILYESLTGQPPFINDSIYMLMMMQVADDPPTLNYASDDKATVDRVNRIIQRCLEKNQADRYQSAEEVQADLDSIFRVHGSTSATMPRSRAKPPGRTFPVSLKVAAGVCTALVAAAGGLTFWQMTVPRPDSRDAPQKQVISNDTDKSKIAGATSFISHLESKDLHAASGNRFPEVERLMLAGQHEKALAAARILAETRTTPSTQELLATCLSKCDKHDEAIAVANRILATHPGTHNVAFRGLLLYKGGRFKECIQDLDNAIPSKNIKSLSSWLALRGLAHYHEGHEAAALADFKAALAAKKYLVSTFDHEDEIRRLLVELSAKEK